jgi:hypothetical protein
MDSMDDMKELAAPLETAAKSLLESGGFDSVFVVATFVNAEGRTCRIAGEAGNSYASRAAALEWARQFDGDNE